MGDKPTRRKRGKKSESLPLPTPRTPLARDLQEIRARVLAEEGGALDLDGVLRELADRRGGVYRPDEDE